MDLGLTDRVFVVTAASSGLGRATARHLVGEGARVVLVARRAQALAEAVAELNALAPGGSGAGAAPSAAADAAAGEFRTGPVALSLTADVAEPDTPARACLLALEQWGRLDGALVSVGGPPAGGVLDMTDEQWHDAVDSVLLAALRTTREVVARATARDVALAWVLSTSVKSPIGGLAISNGLRPGLGMLLKQLADDLGPRGTRLVGLMPGRIATERVEHLDSLAADPEAARRKAEESIPLRRYGRPEEFGRIAAFVLSPAASYLTGCVLPIEGGALRTL